MRNMDYRDIIGGSALIIFGIAAALFALLTLRLGTVNQMGPGMLPAALGVILAVLGLIILVPAFFRAGKLPQIDGRPFVAVLVSVLAFAVMVRPFGIVPAIIVLTVIASRADSKLSPLGVIVVALGLALGATLIFQIGLRMPVAAFSWPR